MQPHAMRALLFCLLSAHSIASHAVFAFGDSVTAIAAGATRIQIFIHKPASFRGEGMLLSLHGLDRNAAEYREHTRALAERFNGLLIVPYFDRERFPTWRYQQAGIARIDAQTGEPRIMPSEQWTSALVDAIIESVRKSENAPGMPYVLIGHSAGGQLLSRLAAFGALDPVRIVVANPSSWVVPSLAEPFPYGFGGLPARWANERALERYLAQPLTVFLGMADTQARNLSMTPGAARQGNNRYERGLNTFHRAQAIARDRGWKFGWTLTQVPAVGHSAARMYADPLAAVAICPGDGAAHGEAPPERNAPLRWPCVSAQP